MWVFRAVRRLHVTRASGVTSMGTGPAAEPGAGQDHGAARRGHLGVLAFGCRCHHTLAGRSEIEQLLCSLGQALRVERLGQVLGGHRLLLAVLVVGEGAHDLYLSSLELLRNRLGPGLEEVQGLAIFL